MPTKIPAWLQIILPIVILFALYKILMKVFGKSAEDKAAEINVEQDEKEAIKEGLKSTYKSSQYNDFADGMYNAMFRMGTDEHTVKLIYAKMYNDLDFLLLNKAFGKRRQELDTTESGLSAWVKSELSAADVKIINGVLKARGITYRI